jgi:hypothetical protein
VRARFAIPLVAAFVLSSGLMEPGAAQETIFNVPSPDVLQAGKFYVETDQYVRSWSTASGHAEFFLVRAVYGVGRHLEVGLNSGAFDYLHTSEPFADATVKWRPFRAGGAGLLVGDNAGLGLRGEPGGEFRNLAYVAGFVTLSRSKSRASAGPYCATASLFSASGRCGALMTFEQPIPGVNGLELAADWFSGHASLHYGSCQCHCSNEGRQDRARHLASRQF